MINAHYYTAAECGLDALPDGRLRLAGVTVVTDPAVADVFVAPASLRHLGPERVARLPYLAGRERQHVFFNVAEDIDVHYPPGPLYLRCEATREIVSRCPTVSAWPWPVEDLYDAATDAEPFEHDVVFQGWASTPLTNVVCDAVDAYPGLDHHIQRHKFFYGYHYHDPAFAHYRESFIRTLRRSRLSLVPRSIPAGVIRYRFYEALSAGRVPVHFNDGRVLPWADKIDWDRCSLHIREANAHRAGPILAGWLTDHTDEQIRAMGAYGREMWLKWLAPARWDELFAIAVQEHLAREAVTQ